MPTAVSTTAEELLEQTVKLAREEVDILIRLAHRRRAGQETPEACFDGNLFTPTNLVHWAREIAEAYIYNARPESAGTASRIWARVRALLMMYTPDWTVDEFVIFYVTRNQYEGFPYGLAVSDLVRLAGDVFLKSRIRTAMTRLARKKLIRRCYTKRVTTRPGNPIPIREHLWFYAGLSSKYAETPDLIYYMNTPWEDRPTEHAA